jgi:hypothetical protein
LSSTKWSIAYINGVLTRLSAMTNQDDIAALATARWKPVS